MLPSLLLALSLIVLGGGLLIWHVRTWNAAQQSARDGRDLAFAGRQFLRRKRASTMIVLLGVAIAAGELVTTPWASLCYWLGVLLLVLLIVGLAILDMAATQQHYNLQRADQDAEEALLARELRHGVGHRHNGDLSAGETAKPD